MNELIEKVEEWGEEKGIMDPSNAPKQFMKFMEEVFEFKTMFDLEEVNYAETGDYIRFNDTKMEFGDVLVTLVILAKQLGLDWEECLIMAYEKIKIRKGKTIDGVFVKEEDLAK